MLKANTALHKYKNFSEVHLDTLDAEFLKHLVDGLFLCLHDDPLGIKHEHVHGEPLGRHPQGVAVRDYRLGCLHYLNTK